jgi:hypothetical protein
MSPIADLGRQIWNTLALVGMLELLLLFVYNLIRGRRLVKAQQGSAKQWSEINTPSLADPVGGFCTPGGHPAQCPHKV